MQDVLVAATPPIVTALLAAAGVWLRRRSQTRSGQRALEDARSRIAVITSVLEAYRADPSGDHGQQEQQLMRDLSEAYRQMYAVEAAHREGSGGGITALARAVLLLDRQPSTATARAVQALYYVSLAWVLLWLAGAILFGLGIAFAESQDSFGVQFAMSLGITVLALAIGLAPALVLHLIFRMSGGRPHRLGQDGQPTASPSG
jgi:hypothetical protein